MSITTDDFFAGKRPWSIIKDQVLEQYMPGYLAKVNRLRRPILLIDGYAGPGVFDDGKPGSPLIMCAAAEKIAKGNYAAFFFIDV
jgi:three-Cys-motif partner protein